MWPPSKQTAPADGAVDPLVVPPVDATVAQTKSDDKTADGQGPPNPLLHLPPLMMNWIFSQDAGREVVYMATVRTMAILSHLAVVIGMIVIGYRHFDNIKTGIAAAMLYLLLPYTAQNTGRVDHVLTAALLIWAIETYRRPLVSGMLMGLAIGLVYYPVFLLPLWIGFYWQRGLLRFLFAFLAMLGILVASLAFTSADAHAFWLQVKQMLGWTSFSLEGGARVSGR